jgi:hypothetical protein
MSGPPAEWWEISRGNLARVGGAPALHRRRDSSSGAALTGLACGRLAVRRQGLVFRLVGRGGPVDLLHFLRSELLHIYQLPGVSWNAAPTLFLAYCLVDIKSDTIPIPNDSTPKTKKT